MKALKSKVFNVNGHRCKAKAKAMKAVERSDFARKLPKNESLQRSWERSDPQSESNESDMLGNGRIYSKAMKAKASRERSDNPTPNIKPARSAAAAVRPGPAAAGLAT